MDGAEPGLYVSVAEDRKSVMVTLLPAGGSGGEAAAFSLEQLTKAIEALGLARQQMMQDRPRLPLEGQAVRATYAADWYVAPELQLGGSVLGFEHPWYGPLGFVVLPQHAAEIARLLAAQCQMTALGSMVTN